MTAALKHFDFCLDHEVMLLGCLCFVNHLRSKLDARSDVDNVVDSGESARAEDFLDFVRGSERVRKRCDLESFL